jgi:hypothetical protein
MQAQNTTEANKALIRRWFEEVCPEFLLTFSVALRNN